LRSSLTIDAFDEQMKRMNISFSPPNTYFDLRLHLNETIRKTINDAHADSSSNFTFNVTCVFFDLNSTRWSSEGVVTQSYDRSNGIANCRTYHLSQFSVIYTRVPRNSGNNNTNGNDTNNNGTNGNDTNNNGTKSLQPEGTFYEENAGRYAAAVALTSIGVIFFVLVQLCFKYESNKVKAVIS